MGIIAFVSGKKTQNHCRPLTPRGISLGTGILLMLWQCSSTVGVHSACVVDDVNHTPYLSRQPCSQQRKSVESLWKRLCLISLISSLFSTESRPKAQPLRGVQPFLVSTDHSASPKTYFDLPISFSEKCFMWHKLKCSFHLTAGRALSFFQVKEKDKRTFAFLLLKWWVNCCDSMWLRIFNFQC